MGVRNRTVITIRWNQTVVDGAQGWKTAGRSLYLALGCQRRWEGWTGGVQVDWNPYRHLAVATVSPGIVRNQNKALIFCVQTTSLIESEGLGICGDGLYGGAADFFLTHGVLRLLIQQHTQHVAFVVWPLCTVHQRSTLNLCTATVGTHLAIGFNKTWLHVEMYIHHITFLPFAVNHEISILKGGADRFSVHFHAVTQLLAIHIVVEVAWNYLTAYPAWNTDFQGKLTVGFLHCHCHVAVPRVVGALLQCHLLTSHLNRGLVAGEQVDVERVVLHCIDILRKGWNKACGVARTAGTAEPSLTLMLAHTLKWIWIEELAAVDADTADHTIVERAFQGVIIF